MILRKIKMMNKTNKQIKNNYKTNYKINKIQGLNAINAAENLWKIVFKNIKMHAKIHKKRDQFIIQHNIGYFHLFHNTIRYLMRKMLKSL